MFREVFDFWYMHCGKFMPYSIVKISEGTTRQIVREYDANNDVVREIIRDFNKISVGRPNFDHHELKGLILV